MSATLEQNRPTRRPARRFGFLLRPGWLGAIVGALAFTAACWLILAPWQFGRNTETSQTNAGIDAALHATPVPVDQHLSTTQQPDERSIWQPVTATGTFLPDRQFYVRLRQDDNGYPVSEIVLPMRLADGTVLLVDRGTRSTLDIGKGIQLPPVPAGVVTVTGRVQQDQTDPRHRQPGLLNGLNQAYAVNSTDLAAPAATPGTTLQGYIQLMSGSPGVLDEIGMPQTDSGPYLSYALQWCAFGAMSLLAIGYFIFREATDPRGADERNVPYPARDGWDDIDDESVVPELSPREEAIAVSVAPTAVNPAAVNPSAVQPTAVKPAPVDPLPAVSAPATASTAATGRTSKKRRARDGFDRSELYD